MKPSPPLFGPIAELNSILNPRLKCTFPELSGSVKRWSTPSFTYWGFALTKFHIENGTSFTAWWNSLSFGSRLTRLS